jgi:histidyl-tRNA synthetase
MDWTTMEARRQVEGSMREVARNFAFREVVTPTFEESELFKMKSGEGVLEEVYFFKDKGDREMCLRPELTAPVIRFYSNDLRDRPKPLKLFYFGNCFRYERPQAGRYREFWQFGCEIIGGEYAPANGELMAVAVNILSAIGLNELVVRMGNLDVLRGVLRSKGLSPEVMARCMRLIDKDETAGLRQLLEEAGVSVVDTEAIVTMVTAENPVGTKASLEVLKGLERTFEHIGDEKVLAGIRSTAEIIMLLGDYGVDNVRIDMGIARGLDYYIGLVFEVDAPELGAEKQVCGGGTYALTELFELESTMTTGFAIGFDRVMIALERKGALPVPRGLDVYIVPFKETRAEGVRIARELRAAGLSAEIDIMGRNLNKALKHAGAIGARKVLIAGAKDLQRGLVTVRDMTSGEQVEIPVKDIVMRVRV